MIRAATESDFEQIEQILLESFQDLLYLLTTNRSKLMKILDIMLRTLEDFILVDDEAGTLRGVIILDYKRRPVILATVLAGFHILTLRETIFLLRLGWNAWRSFPKKVTGEVTLTTLAVKNEFQNQGVGKKLYAAGEETLQKKHVPTIGLSVLKNNRTFNFYQKLGFQTITPYTNLTGEWIYMRKTLS